MTCYSENELIEFASDIARSLKGGEVFALVGELGCGKTTFVKGLALGLGIGTTVTSPTFNLVHRYTGGRLALVHFDLYRLESPSEIEALDLDSELDGLGVIAIEWPQAAALFLPQARTRWVRFREEGESGRSITLSTE